MTMTVKELKAKAKALGLKGYSKMNKADLLEAIAEVEADLAPKEMVAEWKEFSPLSEEEFKKTPIQQAKKIIETKEIHAVAVEQHLFFNHAGLEKCLIEINIFTRDCVFSPTIEVDKRNNVEGCEFIFKAVYEQILKYYHLATCKTHIVEKESKEDPAVDYYNLNKSIIVKNEEPCEVIETRNKRIKFHKNGVVEITYEKDGLYTSYLSNKIKFRELDKRKDWKKAVLVFTKDSFQKEYSLQQRSYYIYSDCKYFNANMGGSSLYGYCLDESDQGVRLDKYMYYENWKVEYCYIVEEKETSKC